MEGLGALLRGWGPPPEMKELGIIMGGGDMGTPRGDRWGAFKEVGGTLRGGGASKRMGPSPPPRRNNWGHLGGVEWEHPIGTGIGGI